MPMKTALVATLGLLIGTGCSSGGRGYDAECEATAVCDGDGCTMVVDIEVGEVSGTLSYDGAPLPDVGTGFAVLTFVPVPRDEDVPPIPMGAGVGRDGFDISVSDGGGQWSGTLPKGTYDVWLNLGNVALNGLLKRPLWWDVQIATDVELGPDMVWDHDVGISTVSGSAPRTAPVRSARVTWINEDGQSTSSAGVGEGTFEIFVPSGKGSLIITGQDTQGGGIYGGVRTEIDATADIEADLPFDVVSLTGPANVSGADESEPAWLVLPHGGGWADKFPIPANDDNFVFQATGGAIELGIGIGDTSQPSSLTVLNPPPVIDRNGPLADILPALFPVQQAAGSATTARGLTLREVEGQSFARVADETATSANVIARVFPGRYDVIAEASSPTAPRDYVLATDVVVVGPTELPAFPETAQVSGEWPPLNRPGWIEQGGHAFTLISAQSPTTRPLPTNVLANSFEFDAFEGIYDIWVSLDILRDGEEPITVHQQISQGKRLKRDGKLDVNLDWVDVNVDVRVNGEVTTDPLWAGVLRFSHNAQPSLATTIPFTPGSQSSILLPEGLYDVTFTRDYVQAGDGGYALFPQPIADCVSVEASR